MQRLQICQSLTTNSTAANIPTEPDAEIVIRAGIPSSVPEFTREQTTARGQSSVATRDALAAPPAYSTKQSQRGQVKSEKHVSAPPSVAVEQASVQRVGDHIMTLRVQREKRCNPLQNVARGFAQGFWNGYYLFPITVWVGALYGAVGQHHWSDPAPESVRLHGFAKAKILKSNSESRKVVRGLQAVGILAKGRHRQVLTLKGLNEALEAIDLGGGVSLTPEQRERIAAYVGQVAHEQARRAPLLTELDALNQEADGILQEKYGVYPRPKASIYAPPEARKRSRFVMGKVAVAFAADPRLMEIREQIKALDAACEDYVVG